jgi:AmmeMemoRadiSam system protein B
MVREPVVAGMFYAGDAGSLKIDMARLIPAVEEKRRVVGLIAPHAGYVYSGACAGKAFARVEIPASVVILGVRHRGFGYSFAVDGHQYWQTPLGDAPIDTELAEKLVEHSKIFQIDSDAGRQEHSLEVQVPFIQTLKPGAKIVPITVSSAHLDDLLTAGTELGELLDKEKDVMVVASTDMSHYIDARTADIQDQKAIDKIVQLDPEGLFKVVMQEDISMCGVAPTVIMLAAARKAGAQKAEIVEYTHSGKVSGDYNKVVAYLSVLVY